MDSEDKLKKGEKSDSSPSLIQKDHTKSFPLQFTKGEQLQRESSKTSNDGDMHKGSCGEQRKEIIDQMGDAPIRNIERGSSPESPPGPPISTAAKKEKKSSRKKKGGNSIFKGKTPRVDGKQLKSEVPQEKEPCRSKKSVKLSAKSLNIDACGKKKTKDSPSSPEVSVCGNERDSGDESPQLLRRSTRITKVTLKAQQGDLRLHAHNDKKKEPPVTRGSQSKTIATRSRRGTLSSNEKKVNSNAAFQPKRTRAGPSNPASHLTRRARRERIKDSVIPKNYVIPLRQRRRLAYPEDEDTSTGSAEDDTRLPIKIERDHSKPFCFKIQMAPSDPVEAVDRLVNDGPKFLYEDIRGNEEAAISLADAIDEKVMLPLTRERTAKEEVELRLLRTNPEEWRRRQGEAEKKRQNGLKKALVALPNAYGGVRFNNARASDFINKSLCRVREPRISLTYNDHLNQAKKVKAKGTPKGKKGQQPNDDENSKGQVEERNTQREERVKTRSKRKSTPSRSPD